MPRSLADFEILETTPILGGGADARAKDLANGEEVRLWIGAPGRAANSGSFSPHEIARGLAKVYQSSLPRVLEGFVDGERAVFVAHAYRGTPLADRVNATPIREAIDIAKGIGAALAKAHAQGFVHGHVDEHAIFLHEDGRPLLLYLGLSPFLGNRPARAPEDRDGPPTDTGDVFGLSRVFLGLAIGRDPCAGGGAGGSGDPLFAGAELRAEDLPEELPEGLRRFLVRSIHPDRAHRIRRAEEFAGDLRVLRASWDTLAVAPQRALPFPTRVGAALVAAVLLLAALAILARGGCATVGFPG